MSSDPEHLDEWIAALFAALSVAEPHNATAIRRLAGAVRARIALDHQAASVGFRGKLLDIRRLKHTRPLRPPWGTTSRECVTSLLCGYLEVSEAIEMGWLEMRGTTNEIITMAAIIEILVDASTRIPRMQRLSEKYLALGIPADLRAWHLKRHATKRSLSALERDFLEGAGLLGE